MVKAMGGEAVPKMTSKIPFQKRSKRFETVRNGGILREPLCASVSQRGLTRRILDIYMKRMTIYTVKNCYYAVDYWGGAHVPHILWFRYSRWDPAAAGSHRILSATVSSLDGFNVRGSADVQ